MHDFAIILIPYPSTCRSSEDVEFAVLPISMTLTGLSSDDQILMDKRSLQKHSKEP